MIAAIVSLAPGQVGGKGASRIFTPVSTRESDLLTPNRYLGAKPPEYDLASSTAGTDALLRVVPTCIFLMPGHFYIGALLLCTFRVMVMLCACRGGPALLCPRGSWLEKLDG